MYKELGTHNEIADRTKVNPSGARHLTGVRLFGMRAASCSGRCTDRMAEMKIWSEFRDFAFKGQLRDIAQKKLRTTNLFSRRYVRSRPDK